MRFARRTVTDSDVAICKGPSRNILMPLEVEQVWTSVWHTQRKSLEVRLGGIQTLGLSLVSLVRIYDLFIVAAWKKLEDVDGLPLRLPQAPRVCHSFTSEVLETKPPTVRMTMLTPLHQERLQDGRSHEEPKRTKRNCNAIIRKTHENQWKPWKVMGCPVSGGFCGFDNRCIPCSYWWTLSSVCSSTSSSKLLSFHAGWTRFAKHIVTIYSDAAKRKGTSQHILIQMEINKIGHLSENCLKNIRKKGVLKWALEVSKHLHDHWCFWYGFAKPTDKQLQRILGWNNVGGHGQGLHYH